MTRKRYKKLMMSIGYKRNVFNKIATYEICGEKMLIKSSSQSINRLRM